MMNTLAASTNVRTADQDGNRAELTAQVGIGAVFDEPPHLLHAGSAFILRQDLRPKHECVCDAENRNAEHCPYGCLFETAEFLHRLSPW
jgi:hypothetical protein